MSNDHLKELASFRAMLLGALTEGLVLETEDNDEEIAAKLDWWFKMNETGNVTSAILEHPDTNKLSVLSMQNDTAILMFGKIENKKVEFFITKETKEDMNTFEASDILADDDYKQQMVDFGTCILFVIRALSENGIQFSVTPELTDENIENEIDEDDWGV